jgi:hypothetical protein
MPATLAAPYSLERRKGLALLLLLMLMAMGKPVSAHTVYLPLISKVQFLQNGDLERGPDGSWTEASTNGFPLILTGGDLQGIVPQSGVWAAWLGGGLLETSTLSQAITIPENAVTLNFYYWIESYELPENCGYDYAYIRWGTTTLLTLDLCETYNTNQWVRGQIDLIGLRGQVGELVFEVVNDDVDHSNFFLDTVAVIAW